jgi:anion transporter
MEELEYSKSANRVATVELPTGELLGSNVPDFLHKFLLILSHKTILGLVVALTVGWAVSQLITSPLLGTKGVAFIATLAAGIVLWISEALDDYVVALLVFLSWIVFDIVPPNLALSGFSTESWFFLVAALGITATVSRSGLFKRMALRLLLRVPPTYQKTYGILLFMSGILLTPLIPTAKGRVTLMTPMVNAITCAVGFKARSSHSAALNLTAYLGIGQMSFLFLTGDTAILGAWSLLPQIARSEFGWMTWVLAAFPLGVVICIISLVTLHLMFSPNAEDARSPVVSLTSVQNSLTDMGSLKRDEWFSIGILAIALGGWVSNSMHGIGETWIATGAFLIALVTGALDKETLQKNIDWSFVLFFGVICSMGVIADKLKIDIWLGTLTEPFLSLLVQSPSVFLMATVLIATVVRVFLRKTASYIFLTLALISWAPVVGVHPGILLLTIVFAAEGWFFQYQDGGYQLFYCTTGGEAFSHRQARRLMIVKFAATFVALLISVPYWRYLGLVR